MSRTRSFVLGFIGLGLAISMTACAPATADANAAYCTSSAAAQSEVAKLKTMVTSSTATLDQIAAQRDAVAKANVTVNKDAEKLADEVKKEVIAADNAFYQAVRAIPSSATVPEASAAYQAAIKDWDQAMLSIRSKVGCKS